jgi:group I intron endonuclease
MWTAALCLGAMMNLADFNPKSAIYIITCTKNGRMYIGQSVDVIQRLKDHQRSLAHGRRGCIQDWIDDVKQYGQRSFKIEIIPCKKKDLLTEEARRIAEAHAAGIDLYNRYITPADRQTWWQKRSRQEEG